MPTFFEILPKIATQPLAIIAYIIVVVGWVAYSYRKTRSRDFLRTLELLPKADRSAFASKVGYSYDDFAKLPSEKRVRLLMGRWVFLGYLATIVAIVILGITAYLTLLGFDMRVVFSSADKTMPLSLSGNVDILFGSERRTELLADTSEVLFQGISRQSHGQTFSVALNCPPYEVDSTQASNFVLGHGPVAVSVHINKEQSTYTGSLYNLNGQPIEGASILLIGTPCERSTDNRGYFAFDDCIQSFRLQSPKFRVTMPGSGTPCSNEFPAYKPPAVTVIRTSRDCNMFTINVGSQPEPPPPEVVDVLGSWDAKITGNEASGDREDLMVRLSFESPDTLLFEASGSRLRHSVHGMYVVRGDEVSITLDGCNHFEQGSKFILRAREGQLIWDPPPLQIAEDVLRFTRSIPSRR